MSFEENLKLSKQAMSGVIAEVKHDVTDFFTQFEQRIGKKVTFDEWCSHEFIVASTIYTKFGVLEAMINQMYNNYTYKYYDAKQIYETFFQVNCTNFSEFLEQFTTNEGVRHFLFEEKTILLLENVSFAHTRVHLAEYLGLLYWSLIKKKPYSEATYFYVHLFSMSLLFPDRFVQAIADKHVPLHGTYAFDVGYFLSQVAICFEVPCNKVHIAFVLGLFKFNYVPNFENYRKAWLYSLEEAKYIQLQRIRLVNEYLYDQAIETYWESLSHHYRDLTIPTHHEKEFNPAWDLFFPPWY